MSRMTKKEAIEVLRDSWFISISGKHNHREASKALDLAVSCFEEAEPAKARARELRSKVRALKAENASVSKENEALRAELKRQGAALQVLLGHVNLLDFVSDPSKVSMEISMPREIYFEAVEPIDSDLRYHPELDPRHKGD